jgi:RNA polymerase sigma-70 factor (ECF subfamily)
MKPIDAQAVSAPALEFEDLVSRYYAKLYEFALRLTRSEAEAKDLTQETFCIWALKGGQLRDLAKVKTWLFTTLHRAFLQLRRHQMRFPQTELNESEPGLAAAEPARVDGLDTAVVLAALARVEQVYQVPVTLFYLEDLSYKEIAARLEVPLGTVKSRIARGITQLKDELG